LFGGAARYLFLARHGLDFVDAAYREVWVQDLRPSDDCPWNDLLSRRGGDAHEALATHWVEVNREILSFKARHPKRVHLVRHDELIADPERVFAAALAFLGEDPQPGIAARAMERAGPLWALEGRAGNWKAWPPELVRRLAPFVNETLKELGFGAV
jgi:hypothetical protein